MQIYGMAVIGGGPGGYTAALYAARAGLNVVVLEQLSAGGQMDLTEQIDNYPGFDAGIDGFTLGEQMQRGAERFGAETILAEVESVELQEPVKRLKTSEGIIMTRTVVIATGATPRPLGIPGEREWTGRGVHYCAACDGMAYSPSKILLQSELIYKIVASALLCHEFSECSRFCELTIFQNKNGIKLIHKMCEGGKTKHRYSFEADANQSKEEGAGIVVEQCLPSRLVFDGILNEMAHHGKSKKVFFKTPIFGKRPQQSHRGLHGRQ